MDHVDIEKMHFDQVLGVLEEIAGLEPQDGLVAGVPQCVIREAVKMLKEKEPVPPRISQTIDKVFYCCGSCGNPFLYRPIPKFCPECGRAVKWNADG